MSESTLSGTRAEILEAVGDFLSIGRNPNIWNREQAAKVTRIVRSGERQFYSPPPVGNLPPHTWSFLRPRTTLAITSGDAEYDLPDLFGGLVDSTLSFSVGDGNFFPVTQTSVAEILRLRQVENLSLAIQPTLAAVNPKSSDGTTGQRFELLLYPTPVANGTLRYTYYAIANQTTDAAPYALGGEVHFETLLASCMAAAELELKGGNGPQYQRFLERLAASIAHDRKMGPKYIGYNGDADSYDGIDFQDVRAGGAPLYNGSPL